MTNKKQTGSYYTPVSMANFIVRHLKENLTFKNSFSVLEPSVGDGAFIEALMNQQVGIDRLTAVDIDPMALAKAGKKVLGKGLNTSFIESDFLDYKSDILYSLIIGNPPYIKKTFLFEEQINKCRRIHDEAELAENSIKNIWTAFLLKSISLLNDEGILVFVLPAELLQVKFAEELRGYLRQNFERIEIFTFKDLLFECKGQDTIVLLGYRQSNKAGLFFANIEDNTFQNEVALIQNNFLEENNVKWNHHSLTVDELNFIYKLKNLLNPLNYYCDSKPGIVTASNKYFIIDTDKEKKYELEKYTKPIIQRGLFVNGGVTFEKEDYYKLSEEGKPVKVLCFKDEDVEELKNNEKVLQYLELGEEQDFVEGYKCKQRKNWFVIPNISTPPEGFFFKRCHNYPKVLKNNARVLVTDSAYKIEMKEGGTINDLVFSFYNSLTLIFAELGGRCYGGGVLELTPTEFKALPLPFVQISSKEFTKFATSFKQKRNIDEILVVNDLKILKEVLNISDKEIQKIQAIRKKLVGKRIK